MAEVISIQDHTLAGLNFATKNVAENKKLFEAKLETWLHRYRTPIYFERGRQQKQTKSIKTKKIALGNL